MPRTSVDGDRGQIKRTTTLGRREKTGTTVGLGRTFKGEEEKCRMCGWATRLESETVLTRVAIWVTRGDGWDGSRTEIPNQIGAAGLETEKSAQ